MTVYYNLLAACQKTAASLTKTPLSRKEREATLNTLREAAVKTCGSKGQKPLARLVDQFCKLGKFPEAIAIAENALLDHPKNLDLLRSLYEAHHHAGDTKKATYIKTEILTLNPAEKISPPKDIDFQIITNTYLYALDREAYRKAALTLIRLYDMKGASGSLVSTTNTLLDLTSKRDLHRLIDTLTDPHPYAASLFYLGCAHAHKSIGSEKRALAALEKAHKIAPNSAAIAHALRSVYNDETHGKKKDALTALLHTLAPASDDYAMDLAALHVRNGSPEKAVRVLHPHFEKHRNTAEPNVKVLEALCQIHIDQRHFGKADEVIESLPAGKGLGVQMLNAFLQRYDARANKLAIAILRDDKSNINALTMLKITHGFSGMDGREFNTFCRERKLSDKTIAAIRKTEKSLIKMRSPMLATLSEEKTDHQVSTIYKGSYRRPVDGVARRNVQTLTET